MNKLTFFLFLFNFMNCSSYVYELWNNHSPCELRQSLRRSIYTSLSSIVHKGFCVPSSICCSNFLYSRDAENTGDCPEQSFCCTNTVLCQNCLDGFKEDNNTCVDTNECEEVFGICSGHKCINTNGSYECECFDSFEMIGDLKTCRQSNNSEADFLFTEASKINLMPFNVTDLRPENSKMLYSATVSPKSIDYSFSGNYMAWTDVTMKVINIAQVNHRKPSLVMDRIVLRNLKGPYILSVDWVHDLIYWTDIQTKSINVVNIDNLDHYYVLVNSTKFINDFKVNVADSCLVWTFVGLKPQIMRSLQDGTNQSILYSGDNQPFYITIDVYLKRYFYVDADHQVLYSIDFEGKNEKKVILNRPGLLSLIHNSPVIYGDDIFLITNSKLYSLNKFGLNKDKKVLDQEENGSNVKTITINFESYLFDLKIIDPILQPSFENKCLNSGCSHMCVPSDRIRVFRCLCPQNHVLVNNTVCVEIQFGNNVYKNEKSLELLFNLAINRSINLLNISNRNIKHQFNLNETNLLPFEVKNEQVERRGQEVVLILILLTLISMVLIMLTRFKIDLSKIKSAKYMTQSHPLYPISNEDSIEEMESKT